MEPGRLLTWGYEGKTPEDLDAFLRENHIEVLVDVRRNAVSRKAGFTKRALVELCGRLRMVYFHFPELGVPPEERRDLRSARQRERLWAWYRDWLRTDTAGYRLRMVNAMITNGVSVCLLRYEAEPERCHRHLVAEAVEHWESP